MTLTEDLLAALLARCEIAHVGRGETIVDGHAPAEHVFVVRSGVVRIERAAGKEPAAIERIGPGSTFGWTPGAPVGQRSERAVADTAACIIRLGGDALRTVAADPVAACRALGEAMAGKGRAPRRSAGAPRATRASSGSLGSRPIGASWAMGALDALRSPNTYLRLLGYAFFLGAWYVTVEALALPRFAKLPGLTQVVREWLSPNPTFGLSVYTPVYYEHIWASVRRVAIAFLLATTLGVPVGVLLGAVRAFREYVFPVFEILRPIPILAWVPLAIVVFSGAETPVVFLAFLASFFATALNTMLGVRSVDEKYLLAARCLGASRWQTFWHVTVPAALPFVFTGLQISVGVAWFSLAAAEMVSGQFGLGYLINTAYTMVQYPTIIIGMLTLGLVGYSTSAVVRAVGERLMRWRPPELGGGRG